LNSPFLLVFVLLIYCYQHLLIDVAFLRRTLVRHTAMHLFKTAKILSLLPGCCFFKNNFFQEVIAGGLTLCRKLNRAAAMEWYILHGSNAPFNFGM